MSLKVNDAVMIFTDGACLGNPGPGGWAALIRYDGEEQIITGSEAKTTNNRMELMGVIAALEALPLEQRAIVHSDSQYVIKGMTTWLNSWKTRGWYTAAKAPVANPELWARLDALSAERSVEWKWVRGHVNHHDNERVDKLARAAARAAAASLEAGV